MLRTSAPLRRIRPEGRPGDRERPGGRGARCRSGPTPGSADELRRALEVLLDHPNPGEHLEALVAREEGVVVGCALAYEREGAAGLHAVATQPASPGARHRDRGRARGARAPGAAGGPPDRPVERRAPSRPAPRLPGILGGRTPRRVPPFGGRHARAPGPRPTPAAPVAAAPPSLTGQRASARRTLSSFRRCSSEAIVRIVGTTVSALREIESIPCRTRNSANSGYTLGPCPQIPTVRPVGVGPLDQHLHGPEHGRVALVEVPHPPEGLRVSVRAEDQLGQVVGADREPVAVLGELPGEEDRRWHLGHQVEQEVPGALQPLLPHHLGDLFELPGIADEREHHVGVLQPPLGADLVDRLQLEKERRPVDGGDVPGAAAPADHGVLLLRLVRLPARHPAVLVRLEVRGPDDHRPRVERLADLRKAVGEPVHELRAAARLDQRQRMLPDVRREDELDPEEPDPLHRELQRTRPPSPGPPR